MKLLSDVVEGLERTLSREEKLVNTLCAGEQRQELDPPQKAGEITCPVCEGWDYFLFMETPNIRAWHCVKCSNARNSHSKVPTFDHLVQTNISSNEPIRAILWPSFCEKMAIGNMNHDVKFENIQQSSGKIEFLTKFAKKPCGILFMQGDPGTGKTFAAMAVCEFFTRDCTSCFFFTQRQLLNVWLDTFKNSENNNIIDKLTRCELLVIDDFGTAEISSGFMSFFMDLINTRMQWTNRGTIITTNLCDSKFSEYCGQALMDRINTGQKFEFRGPSRRKSIPL